MQEPKNISDYRSVARCDYCGKPVFKCVCDDEDWEDIEDQMFEIERGYVDDADALVETIAT